MDAKEAVFWFEVAMRDEPLDYRREVFELARDAIKQQELVSNLENLLNRKMREVEASMARIQNSAVDDGYLRDWFIYSVGNEDPVWTDAHIDELLEDFVVIPKARRKPIEPDLKVCNNCGNFVWGDRKTPIPEVCLNCSFQGTKNGDGPSNWVPKRSSESKFRGPID